jgi:hypothetical protein
MPLRPCRERAASNAHASLVCGVEHRGRRAVHRLPARIGDVDSVVEVDVARPAERGEAESELRDVGVVRIT